MNEGILILDRDGRIVYANRAYADLIGASGSSEVHSVEHAFSGNADAAEAIYRVAQKIREGGAGEEEVRMPGPVNPAAPSATLTASNRSTRPRKCTKFFSLK